MTASRSREVSATAWEILSEPKCFILFPMYTLVFFR